MKRPAIALDDNNVLLDHSTAYAGAWERAFGEHPSERASSAHWPTDSAKGLRRFKWMRTSTCEQFVLLLERTLVSIEECAVQTASLKQVRDYRSHNLVVTVLEIRRALNAQ